MSEKFDKALAKANEALDRMKSPIERERDALKQQLAEAVELLAFYAEPFTWCRVIADSRTDVNLSDIYGEKSRAFLNKIGAVGSAD